MIGAGESDYDVFVLFALAEQEQLFFRQKRPTTIADLERCIKNVIVPGITDSDSKAIRKVYAKRCKVVSEDVSASLVHILHSNNFNVTKEMHKHVEKKQGTGTTESFYHGLSRELML